MRTLLILSTIILFASCTKQEIDKPRENIPMTVSELVGVWRASPMDTFSYFEFDIKFGGELVERSYKLDGLKTGTDNDTLVVSYRSTNPEDLGLYNLRFWNVPVDKETEWYSLSLNAKGTRTSNTGTQIISKIVKYR